MDTIDKLLAEIKAEYDQEQPQQLQQKPNVVKPSTPPVSKSALGIDNLLSEVQADFALQDAAEESIKQQELEKEKIRQEQNKAQQKAALKEKAKVWLEKLDPFSPEGLWFERFSENYASKLEAAVEYLQSN